MTKASFDACGALVYSEPVHLAMKVETVSRIVRQSKIGEVP
jgi:hypothetical protein